MKHTVTLTKDKETKNKIRFSNDPSEPVSGSLYLAKELVGTVNAIKFEFVLPDVAVTAPAPVEAAA